MPRERTREQELRDAIAKAGLLPRDFQIYITLISRADYNTAEINAEFPIRGVNDLAGRCQMSPRSVVRALEHLAQHGWINSALGWRSPQTYRPLHGEPCECRNQKRAPLSGAERTRRWRTKRSVCDEKVPSPIQVCDEKVPSLRRQSAVTVTAPCVTQSQVRGGFVREGTEGEKGEGGSSVDLDALWVAARRAAFPESWKTWPPGTIGAEMNEETV